MPVLQIQEQIFKVVAELPTVREQAIVQAMPEFLVVEPIQEQVIVLAIPEVRVASGIQEVIGQETPQIRVVAACTAASDLKGNSRGFGRGAVTGRFEEFPLQEQVIMHENPEVQISRRRKETRNHCGNHSRHSTGASGSGREADPWW